MWIILAFLFLGFLIGNLVGLTAASVTGSLIALLFAFGGGSAIAFVHRLNASSRKLASYAIVALSFGCLIGIYLSVFVTEHQLLTPESYRKPPSMSSVEARKVLRTDTTHRVNIIDQLHKSGQISAEKAYEMLYESIMHPEPSEERK